MKETCRVTYAMIFIHAILVPDMSLGSLSAWLNLPVTELTKHLEISR
ncbi:hypothetical protein ABEW61_13200 [Paenibacillus amylolyticus]